MNTYCKVLCRRAATCLLMVLVAWALAGPAWAEKKVRDKSQKPVKEKKEKPVREKKERPARARPEPADKEDAGDKPEPADRPDAGDKPDKADSAEPASAGDASDADLGKSKSAKKSTAQIGATPRVTGQYVPPEDPDVQAVLDTKPTTPSECVQAAKIFADTHRPELARQFLDRVLQAKLNPAQLAALGEEFGSALFIDLAGRKEIQPEGAKLCDAVLKAANQKSRDPKRIADLIAKLRDPADNVREQALAGLKDAREGAVGPLLAVLADPARSAEHRNARTAMAMLGAEAVKPLVAALDGGKPELQTQAIEVLGMLNARQAAPLVAASCLAPKSDPKLRAAAKEALVRMIGYVPSRPEAAGYLAEQARQYFDCRKTLDDDVNGRVEYWHWDSAKHECAARMCTLEDASQALALRSARHAYCLTPENRDVRRLYLAAMLEDAARQNGLDKPLKKDDIAVREAGEFGAPAVEEVLETAMTGGHPAAATAAATILGEIGEAKALLHRSSEPAPLVRAVRNADRRLRLAAAEAIVRLQPAGSFAGSSAVPQTLALAAGTSGARRALVASPNTESARTLVGLLAAAGLQVDSAVDGRELYRLAAASPDYELALIDAGIQHPPVAELVQQLRQDWRTATLRVGLIARDQWIAQAEQIARGDPLSRAFAWPHDDQAGRWQLEQVTGIAARDFVPFADRQQQAARALDLLVELSRASPGLYDLRPTEEMVVRALTVPKLGTRAAFVLGKLGTSASQRALVEAASQPSCPLAIRQAAAGAFRRSVEEHHILLTTAEIQRQYQRHNESASADAATQKILASLLDAIEAPTKGTQKVAGGRR